MQKVSSSYCSPTNITTCDEVILCDRATFTVNNIKKWSELNSAKPYIKEAKQRNLTCNVKNTSESNNRNTCAHDQKTCKQSELCVLATRIDGSVRSWDTNIRYKKYVNEAKQKIILWCSRVISK